jgi:hypothetical protein
MTLLSPDDTYPRQKCQHIVAIEFGGILIGILTKISWKKEFLLTEYISYSLDIVNDNIDDIMSAAIF